LTTISAINDAFAVRISIDSIEPDEDYAGYWCYFGFASFCELVLNAVVLGLLCVFLFDFLHSRGWWQQYFQPVLDIVIDTAQPATDVIKPGVMPVINSITLCIPSYMLVYMFIHHHQ
jgi:hypothetical protein